MVAAWMLYAAAVAALLAGAAAALDRALRAAGRPTRLAWAGALAASLLVPAVGAWRELAAPPPPAPAPQAPDDAAGDRAALLRLLADARERALAGAQDAVTPATAWGALDRPLLVGWGLASAAALGRLLLAHRALRRRRRAWRAASVRGAGVLVSRDVGPAVVGVVGPADARVVLPAWALALDDARLALLLAHEREHVRALDPLLLTGAAVAAALVPWSPAVWWQLRRLRLAVEVDCDRRVLRRHPDVRAYGGLLLDVARRAAPTPRLAAAALASPITSLERRIRIMTSRRTRRTIAQGAALAAAAAALFVAACETPRPTGPSPEARPALTKITSASEELTPAVPLSEETLRAAIAEHVPAVARSATGRPQHVWFVADARGRVVQAVHAGPAGSGAPSVPSIDPAAIASVDVRKLAPGRVAPDSVTAVWVALRAPGEQGGVRVAGEGMRMSGARVTALDASAGTITVVGTDSSGLRKGWVALRGRRDDAAAAGGAAAASRDVNDPTLRPSVRSSGRAAGQPAPLYVVDGRELPAAEAERIIGAIDADDITTVEVLKGQAAEQVYGDRGRAGVVRITTKAAGEAPARVPFRSGTIRDY